MNETKVRILDAAERLIADNGLDVSLRTITAEAGVNLAAVNYHFQSKDALIDAVVERHIGPINEERLKRLEKLEREHPTGPLPLDGILEAFLAPVIEQREQMRVLFGRFYTLPDEFVRRVFERHLRGILVRFQTALERSLPDVPLADRLYSLMFTAGVMVHMMAWSRVLGVISGGVLDAGDTRALTGRIVAFTAGGFRELAERAHSSNQGARYA